jgi:hypothetical protein
MREWGGPSRGDGATTNRALFNEPGLFLMSQTEYESILSLPAGRPRPDELLHAIDYWTQIEPAQAACLRTRSPRKPDGRAASASTASTRPTRSLRTGANLVAGDLSAGGAAFGNADRLTVIACCDATRARFAREGMPTPRSKDQR